MNREIDGLMKEATGKHNRGGLRSIYWLLYLLALERAVRQSWQNVNVWSGEFYRGRRRDQDWPEVKHSQD